MLPPCLGNTVKGHTVSSAQPSAACLLTERPALAGGDRQDESKSKAPGHQWHCKCASHEEEAEACGRAIRCTETFRVAGRLVAESMQLLCLVVPGWQICVPTPVCCSAWLMLLVHGKVVGECHCFNCKAHRLCGAILASLASGAGLVRQVSSCKPAQHRAVCIHDQHANAAKLELCSTIWLLSIQNSCTHAMVALVLADCFFVVLCCVLRLYCDGWQLVISAQHNMAITSQALYFH